MSSEEEDFYPDVSDHSDESDHENASSSNQTQTNQDGFSVANFLMGNVNKQGKLEPAEYDEEVVKALGTTFVTSSFNDLEATKTVGTLLKGDEENSSQSDPDYDYTKKNDDAIDFSEEANIGDLFDEMNSDLMNNGHQQPKQEEKDDYDDELIESPKPSVSNNLTEEISKVDQPDVQKETTKTELQTSLESVTDTKTPKESIERKIDTTTEPTNNTESSSSTEPKSDSVKLIEAVTKTTESNGGEKINEKDAVTKDEDGFVVPKLPTPTEDKKPSSEEKKFDGDAPKKLDTPLGAMLPSKYANANVTDLFPEFRPHKVLRFSRLFGKGKTSVLPQIWRGHRRQRKNREQFENQISIELKADEEEEIEDLEEKFKWKMLMPEDDEIDLKDFLQEDGEITLLKNDFLDSDSKNSHSGGSGDAPDWRHSASKYWYDKYKVPENGEQYDFGFKLKSHDEDDFIAKPQIKIEDPEDAFHLITQSRWEDDIIWDPDAARPQVLAKLNGKDLYSGWLPSGINRTAKAFENLKPSSVLQRPQLQTTSGPKRHDKKDKAGDKHAHGADTPFFSVLPIENDILVNGNWENDIIWDPENMEHIPEPKLVVLDRNDENIILDIPIDVAVNTADAPTGKHKEKPTGIRKSRLLLGKAGVIAEPEMIQPPSPPSTEKDPFNISNDEYYADKTTPQQQIKTAVAGNLIQHSIPAIELRPQFFPTFLNYNNLRNFHRPSLKRYSYGLLSDTLPHGVNPLLKHIKKKAKQREQYRIESGGGEMFFMRTPEDLTGKDGDLILAEFSEEFPPLMMQIGMATKIKNFYRRKHGKDNGPPPLKYGEITYCSTSPFLGLLTPGQCLQAFENNMVRAPIYEHQMPDCDFLIIRHRDGYYIREVETIFTVGQELPLQEVPGPSSKKANNFIRDFLQVFIYRLFWRSTDVPRRIKMEDIKKAFPMHSESSIRKRLKQCADFKRTGMDSNWWVIKSDFRLPSEDEIRAMVSPEACCAYYSMLSAEQRLKDGGYGEKYVFADEGEDDNTQLKMEDEVKAAPWNTTRAFTSAMKGKCLLQLTGVADPTGCGEGFSYIRIPNKPTQTKEEIAKNPPPKKIVSGTEADLRKLPLEKAKEMLRSYGFSEEEMKKLSRWEIIDVVRTYSTKKAKETESEEADGFVNKFARGNRFSIAEHQERYKEECQRIFDLQNKVLASKEDLSTDEDESDDEDDSELEEMGKNIESLLTQKKTIHQLSRDIEEEERRELKKMLMGDKKKTDPKSQEEDDKNFVSPSASGGKILKIHRTFVKDGKEFVRVETVRKSAVIDTYVRIRSSKDETFIKQFATGLDDQQKEEKRKEKRRVQEQLRRMKRNQEKEKFQKSMKSSFGLDIPDTPPKEKPPTAREIAKLEKRRIREEKRREKELAKLNSNSKCGACGGTGHYRNNKSCPMYQGEDSQHGDSIPIQEDGLVHVDDTRVVLNKNILKKYEAQAQAQEAKKLSKSRTNSKDSVPGIRGKKRKSVNTALDNDYLQKPEYRVHNRRRIDPLVVLCEIFEECINEMKALPDTRLFHMPVSVKDVPDYYKIITNPMDLQTMRENVRAKLYKDRESFLKDLTMIHANCVLYNGQLNPLSAICGRMVEVCAQKLQERESEILKLEKMINPIRDESDLVAFSYILKQIVTERLKTIPESWPFKQPVNRKSMPHYYDMIKTPMDLETIELNLDTKYYKNRGQFMRDIELIHENSIIFNGPESPLTAKAFEIVEKAKAELAGLDQQLDELESGIRADFGMDMLDDYDESSRMSFESYGDSMHPTPAKHAHIQESESNIEDDLRMSDDDDDDDDEDVFEEHPHGSMPQSQEANMGIKQQAVSNMMMYQEPSMDGFDQNYDPSEFLLSAGFGQQGPSQVNSQEAAVLEQDLDLSDSSNDDEEEELGEKPQLADNDDDDDDDDDWY